jgi:hypothetical protein
VERPEWQGCGGFRADTIHIVHRKEAHAVEAPDRVRRIVGMEVVVELLGIDHIEMWELVHYTKSYCPHCRGSSQSGIPNTFDLNHGRYTSVLHRPSSRIKATTLYKPKIDDRLSMDAASMRS